MLELLVSWQHLQVLTCNYCFPRPLEHKSTHVTRVSPPTDRAHRRVAPRLRDFNGSYRESSARVDEQVFNSIIVFIDAIAADDGAY